MRSLLVCLVAALLAACHLPSAGAPPSGAATLRLATWNMEWLLEPREFRRLARGCVPQGGSPQGRRRYLPCDIVADHERSAADFAAMARYARQLDADVVALQEVDGPGAAARVFPGYRFCFTRREAVQNTGFAIRPGIPFRCGPDYEPLSLGDRVRRGAVLTLFPGEPREVRLLGVHLKSGCGRRGLDDPREACALLAEQAAPLEQWIDGEAAAGHAFAVLGDFNRDLLADAGPEFNAAGRLRSLWAAIDDGDPPAADLADAAAGQAFQNCSPAQNFGGYIDHILLSPPLAQRRRPGGFHRITYDPQDALQRRLPDHCPVAVDLESPGSPAANH